MSDDEFAQRCDDFETDSPVFKELARRVESPWVNVEPVDGIDPGVDWSVGFEFSGKETTPHAVNAALSDKLMETAIRVVEASGRVEILLYYRNLIDAIYRQQVDAKYTPLRGKAGAA